MGFVKRAVVAIMALGAGALLVANWRSQSDLHRKFEALAATLSGKPSDVPASVKPAVSSPASQTSAEPRMLPPGLIVPAGGIVPRDVGHASLPQYVIEPPDNLTIEAVLRDPRTGLSDRLPVQPIGGDYVVRPDGTVSLGVWGTVRVAGLTTSKAADAIRAQLASFTQVNGTGARLETLAVTVDVKNKNSQVYYIIADMGQGEQTYRMPYTGSETVLDAIAAIPGLAAVADRRSIRVVRKGAGDQILPVDWTAILHHGDTRTNYALMSGDRVYVSNGR